MSTPSQDPSQTLPTNALSFRLDSMIAFTGKLLSWLWVVTIAVVLTNVFSRFILGRGSIALEELSWHFFGATMIMTLAYAIVTDDHVRVDVLRERFSLRLMAWIELLGIALLMLPLLYFIIDQLIEYAYRSFEQGENSQAPSGLPYRFILKSTLPIGMILIAVAMVSRLLRCTTYLFKFPREVRPTHPTDFR